MPTSELPIGYLLKRVQSSLRRTMDAALASEDLSMALYAAMFNLALEPDLSNAELARRSFVTPQTMIRIVRALEDDGWIHRRVDPANQRRHLCSITDEGRARLDVADELADAVERRMIAGLKPSEVDALRAHLTHCLENLEPADDPPA